jgi:hypothetical protein
MTCPRIADRGDGLQMQRVAAYTLNKQLRTADKGWSSSLEVGRGANKSSPKKSSYTEMLHRASELDGFFGMIQVTENRYVRNAYKILGGKPEGRDDTA